ncbi:PREDICTED: G patch domain-containing protein 4, partial [Acanthisitta chloris]|uniref:G patch domain-containing protein 4 n=1 Tax=Acanthisitta chloris TaxID=57068 RepID=UPI0004F0E4DC
VGHDPAETFTFHWWDHVFNKAAANVTVEPGQDGISVKVLSEQGGRNISTKRPLKVGSTGDLLYGRFVKSATLTAHGEESLMLHNEEEEEELDLSSCRRLTDEELVEACGGRTAHKGARHGLTMSAKLARLEEQERAFLAKYQHKERQQEVLESSQGKEKRKRNQSKGGEDLEVLQSQESSGQEVSGGEEK